MLFLHKHSLVVHNYTLLSKRRLAGNRLTVFWQPPGSSRSENKATKSCKNDNYRQFAFILSEAACVTHCAFNVSGILQRKIQTLKWLLRITLQSQSLKIFSHCFSLFLLPSVRQTSCTCSQNTGRLSGSWGFMHNLYSNNKGGNTSSVQIEQ